MYRAKKELLEKKDEIELHDDVLIDTDLIPLINTALKSSFSRIDKNQNTLADTAWKPLNQNLLPPDDLRATMAKREKLAQYHISNDIIIPQKTNNVSTKANKSCTLSINTTESEASSSESSLSNHPLSSSTTAKPGDELNFSSGESLRCLKAMLSQDQLHAARERIRDDMNDGKSIKEQLKANSRLSVGIVFKTGTNRLGKTVFDVCKDNQMEKKQKEIDKMKQEENEYKKNVENAMKVWDKKGNVNEMTIRELTIVCKPFKRKTDGKMPNKKPELIAKYNEWVGRPAPVFNYDDVNGNIVASEDNVAVMNNNENDGDANDNLEFMSSVEL